MLIIPSNDYSKNDEQELINLLREDTTHKVDFEIIKCKKLQYEPNGKKRTVIQKVNTSTYFTGGYSRKINQDACCAFYGKKVAA